MNDTPSEKLARQVRDGMRGSRFSRSGLMTALILAVVLAGLLSLRLVHVKNRMNELTTRKDVVDTTPTARPGNRDLIHLTRLPMDTSMTPEFISATIAPGVGMKVLQLTLNMPGRGGIPLLLSTPPENIAKADRGIVGAGFVTEVESRDGSRWTAPVNILAARASDIVNNSSMPDGGEATAVFPAQQQPGEQASVDPMGVETKVTANMSGHAVEMSIVAKNVSDSPRSVVLSWEPRLLAPSNGLSHLTVVPPMSDANHVDGEARSATPIPLGRSDVNLLLTGLRRSYLSNGPELELRNETDSYTLHMTALSPSIHSLRIQAPRNGTSALISFSTAGRPGSETERTVLQPGETLQWRVRLEVTASATYQQPVQ